MAEDQAPVFQIQRIYLKDLSLEQPNSPGILLSQEQPSVDIQLALAAEGCSCDNKMPGELGCSSDKSLR